MKTQHSLSSAYLGRALYLIAAFATLLFILAPLAVVIWASFFSNKILSFPPQSYTFDWFIRAWQQDVFRDGFILSLQLGVMATIWALILGVPAALALARFNFPGREVINAIIMSPLMVPGIVAGAAMYIFFIEFEIQTEVPLVGSLPGLSIAHILIALPWTVRLVTASMVSIDRQVEEAALSLGAHPLVTFFKVTLPLVRPGIVAGGMFSFIVSFIDLEKSLFLVGPGRVTLPIAIVNYLEWNLDSTIAAVATMQILVIALALLISDRYFKLSRSF